MDTEQRTTADRERLVKASLRSWAGRNRRAQQRAVDRAWAVADRPGLDALRWALEGELEAALGVARGADVDRLSRIDRAALDVAAETLWAALAAGDLAAAERELLLAPWRATFGVYASAGFALSWLLKKSSAARVFVCCVPPSLIPRSAM
jgi:hypothetical protein